MSLHFDRPQTQNVLQAHPIVLDLPTGTRVRIKALGEATRPTADFAIDYDYLALGRLSRFQVRKAVRRWMMNTLWTSIWSTRLKEQGQLSRADRRHEARNDAWARRYVRQGEAAAPFLASARPVVETARR